MTVIDAPAEETTLEGENTGSEGGGKRGRSADRDFTKFNHLHEEIAEFVNANSGLDAVTPNQVKAVLLLRSDYANSDEQKQAREARKKEREAEAKIYAGLTEDEIKLVKAQKRAEENLRKSNERAAAALEKAKALREANEASGEDLAAAVESEQQDGERKRGIGRRNR